MREIITRVGGGFLVVVAMLLIEVRAYSEPRTVTICALEQNWEHRLNQQLEIRGNIEVGGEHGLITDQGCRFLFAFGSDYQTFGNRYRATTDREWAVMWSVLHTRLDPPCNFHVRVAKARMRGTLIRVPRTGTIPQDEMPPEFVIRRVYEVTEVPILCPKN